MIVDFVSIKETLRQRLNILLRQEVKKRTPFLSSIGTRLLHEGDKYYIGTAEKENNELELQRGESSFTLTTEEMSSITVKEIVVKIQSVAEDIANQMERHTFRVLNEGMEKNDRQIPGNPPFSPDTFLKALEMLDIDFAEDDPMKPHLPTLVMGPELDKKAMEQEEKMTVEEKRQFNEKMKIILTRKYEDYVQREGQRKIID